MKTFRVVVASALLFAGAVSTTACSHESETTNDITVSDTTVHSK